MGRIRSVHPDICLSGSMAALNDSIERTFIRLWTYVDDQGRGRDDTRLIKAAIYPLNDDKTPEIIEDHLEQLAELVKIIRYDDEDGSYFCIRPDSWDEFQHPQKSRQSKFPTPPGYIEVDSRPTYGHSSGAIPQNYSSLPIVLSEGSAPGRNKEEGRNKEGRALRDASGGEDYPLEFQEIWKVYPRKVDKNAAFRAFIATSRRGVAAADLLRATAEFALVMKAEGRDSTKIKHCGTFLGPDEPWRQYLDGAAASPVSAPCSLCGQFHDGACLFEEEATQ